MVQLFRNPFTIFKKRNIVFDLLKLFAALLVVLDHSLQRWVDGSQTTQFYNFIFLTQMPLFMFIAGFFASRKIGKINAFKDLGVAIGKTALSLLVPYFSFSLIKCSILSESFDTFFDNLLIYFLSPQYSLWFLWALFWLETFLIISAFLTNLFKIKKQLACLIVVLAIFILFIAVLAVLFLKVTNYFDLKLIVFYSLFFIFGILACSLKDTKLLSIRHLAWFKPVFAGICLIVLAVVMFLRPTIVFDDETIINMGLRIVGSVASICLCYCAFFYVAKIKFMGNVSVVGSLSLEMYYTHLLLFLIPLLKEQLTFSVIVNVLLFVCLYIAVITIVFAVIMLFKSCTITDLVLYGKYSFKKKQDEQKTVNDSSVACESDDSHK